MRRKTQGNHKSKSQQDADKVVSHSKAEEESIAKRLKEEVTNHAHEYIRHRTIGITKGLTNRDPEVRSLLTFGDDAIHYTAKVLATIGRGTQHWKMGEANPLPIIPTWLWTIKAMQNMIPIRVELSCPPPGMNLEDIWVCSLAIWLWMSALLQFWQDHLTTHLFSGQIWQPSRLAEILLRDLNPCMPHKDCPTWDMVAKETMTWLDISEQFLEEWEAQKTCPHDTNALEHATEATYHGHL